MHSTHRRLIVLGSGPAGCTAALYGARANLSPLLITGSEQGGQLMTTSAVDNWPADVEGVLGPILMERFLRHAERFQAELAYEHVTAVDLSRRPFRLSTDLEQYTCDALIIATGATAKALGLQSEAVFSGRGVSGCATCDGYHFKGLPVAIVGGGNTAVEEALLMSNVASHVTLIHRRDSLRAEPILVEQLLEKQKSGNVNIAWNCTVRCIVGDTGVQGVKIENVRTGVARMLDVRALFVAVGHNPNTRLFAGQIQMQDGYILTGVGDRGETSTSIPGVFAAGDVQDQVYRQAVTSAGSGCMAAIDAQRFLESSPSGSEQLKTATSV